MAEELDEKVVEYMADQAVSRFINTSSKKRGIVTFDLKADGYVYKITYKLYAAGEWRMVSYTCSLLK